METNGGKSTGVQTHNSKTSENSNPNIACESLKVSKSPSVSKSASKTQKSASKNQSPNPTTTMVSPSPQKKIRQRKFVVAKRTLKKENAEPLKTAPVACKCNKSGGQKCLCVAYETLRASQEGFFKYGSEEGIREELKALYEAELRSKQETENNEKVVVRDLESADGGCGGKDKTDDSSPIIDLDKSESNEHKVFAEMGVSTIKRRRDRLMEEARENVPDAGSGRVMHLVKAFEKLLSIPKSKNTEEKDDKEVEDTMNGLKWALPGLPPPNVSETQVSSSSFCPSDFYLTSESLGLVSRRASSLGSQGSISSRTLGGGRKSRRKSAESAGTHARRQWKRGQPKATSQKPFKLRTEQRGKCKEEEFFKKVKEMMEEEERQRIPIAQGLPWTTDEPERLVKPPVKEITRPTDLVLHSDIRAVERAEFDHQVAEKWNFIEQYKMERERLQKLAEEEEIRRLRKELVPKAQPMPYFDRPFIPRSFLLSLQMSHSTEHLQAEHQNPFNKGSEVFIGGLARTVTENKIREGFGFVRFATKEAAEKAVKEKSGYVIDGRKIGVLPSIEQDTLFFGNLNKAIQWAEEEPEIDQKEIAKIKIAFVRNLPSEADENYLRELFERFGKVERVVLPRKGNSLVGFVHFEKRLDLDNAIKELNEKTLPGPNGGPPYKLQVEVARPMDKSKKRVRDESQSKSSINIQNHPKEPEEVKVSDPYEAAIVALPAVVTERLLRIMRLGIATRYDQIAKFLFHYARVGKHWSPSSLSRVEDATLTEPDTVRYSKQVRLPVDSYGPHVPSPGSRSGLYGDLYSPTLPHHLLQGRVTTRLEETSPPLQIRSSTSAAYGRAGPTFYNIEETSPPLQRPLSSAAYGRVVATLRGAEETSARLLVPPSSAAAYGRAVTTLRGAEEASARLQVPPSSSAAYGRVGLNSYTTNAADHPPTRSQVRFDPFTGEPYKFDPFTGEPILPESSSR
nr:protein tpx2 [Ipomoea batatas]